MNKISTLHQSGSVRQIVLHCVMMAVFLAGSVHSHANDLVDTVEKVSKGIVAIGLYTPVQSRSVTVLGTGFVVGKDNHIVTNYHVVSDVLDPSIVQYYVALYGTGRKVKQARIDILEVQPQQDLALLKPEKSMGMQALTLTKQLDYFKPGSEIAFTGFPIGAVLGLYPATHRGLLAAVTPDAIPTRSSTELSADTLMRLQSPTMVYQLDATAYPGNSGSPVYMTDSGEVVGVLNKVLLKSTKESALSDPSDISYAIPIKYVYELCARANVAC